MEERAGDQDYEHGGDQHHVPGALGGRQPGDPQAYRGLSQQRGLAGGGAESGDAVHGQRLAWETVKNTR